MFLKRCFDLFFAIPGIIILLPVFIIIGVLIKIDSPGPLFFRQTRVGRFGVYFSIYKFRTMIADAEKRGRSITVGKDWRITRCGSFLRKYKLDELPQLINVIRGEMSLVGPRPEVPQFIPYYPAHVREVVLSLLPGITDYAAIAYKDESGVLGKAKNPDMAYVKDVLPVKLDYYVRYAGERSLWVDFKLIIYTILAICGWNIYAKGSSVVIKV